MRFIHRLRFLYIALSLLTLGVAFFIWQTFFVDESPDWVTEQVSRGTVSQIVSVSGVIKAENAASLAFPVSGIVSEVLVAEGQHVAEGDVLATLQNAELEARRQDAVAALLIAKANRDELIYGPRDEAKEVTDTTVAIAKDELERITLEEAEKVASARRTLLSADLEAIPVNKNTNDTAPTISGTYTCTDEGAYTMSVFKSNAKSGYSYRLAGLESGVFTAYTEAPAPMGTCGLRVQFDEDEVYANADWIIDIPNTRSSSYATNLGTYELALQQQTNKVAAAEQALLLAENEEILANAAPRTESLQRANANVTAAQAGLAAIDAQLEDRIIRAPFDGTINSIDIARGESTPTTPIITMVADNAFKLIARIPEIDIAKLKPGQHARMVFDAQSDSVIEGTVSFISPLATEIDGVAYFEATIQFNQPPTWLRGGLNADVEIIVEEQQDVLRVPKRFIAETNNATYALVARGNKTATTTVEILFTGNDGYVAITGLTEGDIVVAP